MNSPIRNDAGIRSVIETDDEEGFAAAKEWLLDRFEGWLPAADAGLAGVAALALGLEWGYCDGYLTRCRGHLFGLSKAQIYMHAV